MKVKEVMHKGVDWVGPETPITEIANQYPCRITCVIRFYNTMITSPIIIIRILKETFRSLCNAPRCI